MAAVALATGGASRLLRRVPLPEGTAITAMAAALLACSSLAVAGVVFCGAAVLIIAPGALAGAGELARLALVAWSVVPVCHATVLLHCCRNHSPPPPAVS